MTLPTPEADDQSPIFKDFSSANPHLLVSFGGLYGGFGAPTFEFSNVAKVADIKKLYVRDLRQALYHIGLPGYSTDIPGTLETLRALIAESQAETITFIGNSQGGYAAILFGALLNVDDAHAFSTQTVAGPIGRWRIGDNRWPRVALNLYIVSLFKKKYYDLKKVINASAGKTKFHLYYGTKDPHDVANAEYLRGARNVTLHSYELSKRQLLKHIMDSGLFDSILHGTSIE